MSPTKRALLIAIPYGELQGPTNDVELIASVLKQQSFEITRCCGTQATCKNIRTQWQHLIRRLHTGDIAVIYYSGHGGIVQSTQATQNQSTQITGAKPWRYQFIVPIDFDQSSEGDFRGILDIELSQLLRATTDKTTNVTLILDCCHAGRMARQPGYGIQARAKNLPRIYYHDISLYIEQRRSHGHFMEEAHIEGNPNAVRIIAAATSESAFEYTNQAGTVYGAMTEVLASAIQEGCGQDVSWRSTLMRVREAVNVNFPQQHPCVEGPETRLHFSVKQVDIERSKDFVLKVVNGVPRIQAGRIAGVHEGNVYAVMPLNSSSGSTAAKITDAVVRNVFSSYAELDLGPDCKIESIPAEGSLAILRIEAVPRWPVMLSDDLSEFRAVLDSSRYLRCIDNNQSDPPLMSTRKEIDKILLSTNLDIDIASATLRAELPSQVEFGALRERAEHLARAQHLLSLQNGEETALQHNVLVDVGWVSNGKARKELLDQDGEGCLTEDDRIFIRLTNHGPTKVFISVFDVNVAGTISLISASSPEGIELEADQVYNLGKEQFSEKYRGLNISWPKDIPKSPGINERLVFIFSSSQADLRHLVNPGIPRSSQYRPLSTLVKLIDEISFGCKRDVGKELEEGTRFTISQIPFLLKPRAVLARALPTPDQCAEWPSLMPGQLVTEPSPRSGLRALVRLAQGVPPHVYVVNHHEEEITVVVSKYRPNRMASGLGINASATGAGLDFSTTTFISPATRKTLQPSSLGSESSRGEFPLWTRREGFGVITIFTGSDKTLFIENDRIPLGSTAFFTGEPNLRIVEHKPREVMQECGSTYSQFTMAHRSRYAASGQVCSTREDHADNIHPMALTPEGKPVASASHGRTNRHMWTSNMDDQWQEITNAQEALAATPLDHPDHAGRLSDPYASLANRYGQAGSMSDLEQALRYAQEALTAAPSDHPDRSRHLRILGVLFGHKYRRTGSMDDLQQALGYTQEALAATAGDASPLNNVSTLTRDNYSRTGSMRDLGQAITYAGKAPAATSGDVSSLNNLGILFRDSYSRTGSMRDLEQAFTYAQETLVATPSDHPDRASRLNNLSVLFENRYNRIGSMNDLQQALEYGHEAVDATPSDHPCLAGWLNDLGNCLKYRYELTQSVEDDERSVQLFKDGANCCTSLPFYRIINGSQAMLGFYRRGSLKEAAEIAETVLGLLPYLCDRYLNRDDQEHALEQVSKFAADACSLSIKMNDPHQALRRVEFGRALILGYLIDGRRDSSELALGYPDLAKEYDLLRYQAFGIMGRLENTTHQKALMQERQNVALSLLDCERRIRGKPEFENFLQPASVHELMQSATGGPIVIVNCTEIGSDAIVVSMSAVEVVPLPDMSSQPPKSFRNALERYSAIKHGGSQRNNRRDISHHHDTDLLSWLRSTCVECILQKVAEIEMYRTPSGTPRIRWIGTGAASCLPFHAASKFDTGTQNPELEVSGDALRKALDRGQGNAAQIMLEKNISIEALLHDAIRLGRLRRVRYLIHMASSTSVVHGGVNALYAAYSYVVLEVVKLACTFTRLSPLSQRTLQSIDGRIEICTFLELFGPQAGSWGAAEHNKILEQDFRAVEIPTGKHHVSLHQWEYPEAVKTWKLSSHASVLKDNVEPANQSFNLTAKMMNTVTISGHGACFKAMSCEQYVRKRWGNIGIEVASCLTTAAELVPTTDDENHTSQAQVQTIESVIKLDSIGDRVSKVVAYACPSHVCLFVQNLSGSEVHEIQEIAQWMCQTFRPLEANHSGTLQMSSTTQPAKLYSQVNLVAVAFCLLPLKPLEIHQADCWTAFFKTGIVAETPRSEDPELEGIEMSFDLMTNLAAVETYHYLEHNEIAGGLILLSFFTALVLMRLHHSGAIHWHFEFSETDVIRPVDLESTQEPWLFVNAPSELSSRRCVIGIWPQANIMLGVKGTKLDFEDSGLPHRSSVLRAKGFEFTAGISPLGGPVQGILQGTRIYEHINTRQRFSCATTYITALSHLSQKVSLVYDCKTQTGWLVPQISLLLHLCHAYYAKMSITNHQTDPIPWAKPSTDGASAALDAFEGSGDIIVRKVGDQTDDRLLLRQLLVNLNSNVQITHDTRQSPKKILHWTTEVYLSELQDQIREPDEGSALRVLNLSDWPSINAWLDIVQKVDGLLVCKNFDQAIVLVGPPGRTPATTLQAAQMHLPVHPSTCSCGKVPEGRGYLVAHVWCLQNVLRRPNSTKNKDNVTWLRNGEPLDVGSFTPDECIWTHPERVLQSFGKPGRGYACDSSRVNPLDGAVVFGRNGRVRKK